MPGREADRQRTLRVAVTNALGKVRFDKTRPFPLPEQTAAGTTHTVPTLNPPGEVHVYEHKVPGGAGKYKNVVPPKRQGKTK